MGSLSRAIRVLELLAQRSPLGVREIARHLDLPVGSTHRLLVELDTEAVVERTARGEWELSYRLVQIVGKQMEQLSLPRLARPLLEQFASETQETVFLAVPSRDEIVYLDKVQTDLQVQLNVELGTRRPMHCTGLGKAILAFLPEAQQAEFLRQGPYRAYTPHTITDPHQLYDQLQLIRQQGYATDREEILLGVNCIAVPILNNRGQSAGAISVATSRPQVYTERFSTWLRKIRTIGDQLSSRLGAPHYPMADL